MAGTTVLTSKNFGTDGGSRLFSVTVTSVGVTTSQTLALTSINGYLLGVYHDLSSVGSTADLKLLHNSVDLLGGIGGNLSTTEGYLPSLVIASGTDFANGLPVAGVVTVDWSGTLTTTAGVLVLMFLGLGR